LSLFFLSGVMDEGLDVKKLINDGRLDLKLFKQECSTLKNTLNTAWQHKRSKQSVWMNKSRLAVDQKTRQLQNLFYELEHLKESIQTCLGFRSLHEEINLIPEEEYASAVGTSEACNSEHQQTLDRLYWELEQRKKLL
uniref:HAUS augmin-like complex subunit 4 n=1 Tax=Hydatigena taeniaeformis TaxID=6205 RepID=A0A0R3WRF3_HYDTA